MVYLGITCQYGEQNYKQRRVLLKFVVVLPFLFMVASLACTESPGGLRACLDEESIEDMVQSFHANPQTTKQPGIGAEKCLDGIATFVDVRFGQVAVTVSVAPEVGVLLNHSEATDPENYHKLKEWTDTYREGDIIRAWCEFDGFFSVEGAPEPMVIPVFSKCRPGEFK